MKILALGGCGQEGAIAVEEIVKHDDITEVVIADIDIDKARALAIRLGGKVTAVRLDVNDAAHLRMVMKDCDAAVSFVGPYYRYGRPILQAAIDTGTDIVDINDDYDASLDALEMDDEAKTAGITAVIGLGASPGLFNLVAQKGARMLDRADAIDIRWCVSIADFEGEGASAAVPHLFHMVDAKIPQLLDGKMTDVDGMSGEETVEFHKIGKAEVYYVGHAEPVTLPKYIPTLQRCTNKGSIPGADDLLRAFRELGLTSDEPFHFSGVSVSPRDVAAQLIDRLPSDDSIEAYSSGKIIVEGDKDGKPTRVVFDFAGPNRMGPVTGLSAAVGLLMVARGEVETKGVFAPEGGVDPDRFISQTEDLGISFEHRFEPMEATTA